MLCRSPRRQTLRYPAIKLNKDKNVGERPTSAPGTLSPGHRPAWITSRITPRRTGGGGVERSCSHTSSPLYPGSPDGRGTGRLQHSPRVSRSTQISAASAAVTNDRPIKVSKSKKSRAPDNFSIYCQNVNGLGMTHQFPKFSFGFWRIFFTRNQFVP